MTAVELLKKNIDSEIKLGTKMVVNWDMYLEMEKQQIINAYQAGDGDAYNLDQTELFAKAYFDETYGSNNHIVDTNEMIISQTDENGKPLTFWRGIS